MTTLAEIDVVINAKLDPLLAAGKKAEAIIRDLDKKLNQLSAKTVSPKITVQANTQKIDEVIKKLNQLSGKNVNINTKPAVSSVDSLRSSVSGLATTLAAGFGVREIQQYADAWTSAGNKIRSAAEGAGVQTRSLEELNQLANESRAGFEETVDLYAKLTRAASGVAKSETEIALATETVTKAMKSGGASVMEQKSAIMQLGQALGSGVLQGDELRSIRENSPILARAIAKEFDTTVAGLKKLGSEGKLVSDRVFKAILSAAKDIDKQFQTTIPTIADSFKVLSNSVTEYIGKLNESSGIGATVSTIMSALAGNIENVAAAAAAAGLVLLVPGAVAAAAALLNPWVLLAAAVGTAAYAIHALWDEVIPLQGSFATLGDYANVTWQLITDGVNAAQSAVVSAFQIINESIAGSMSDSGAQFTSFLEVARNVVNETVQLFINLKDTIALSFEQLPAAIANGVVAAMNYMIGAVETGINKVVSAVNRAITAINSLASFAGVEGIGSIGDVSLDRIADSYAGAAEKAAKSFNDIWARETTDYVGQVGQSITDTVNNATTAIVDRANAVAAARMELERETNRAANFGGTSGGSGAGSTAGYGGGVPNTGGGGGKKAKKSDYQKEIDQIKEKTAALVAETQAQAALNPLIDEGGFAAMRAKAAQELLTAAKKSGIAAGKELSDVQQLLSGNFANLTPAAREQAEAMLELATKYSEAEVASDRLKESQDRARQAMEDTKQLGKDVLGGFIKDLQAGKSASEALSNALSKVADKLMDMALNSLFGIGGAGGGGGGLFGGLFQGLGSLFGGFFAEGGTPPTNKVSVVGEKGPELFVPKTSGVIVPNNQLRPGVGGGGGNTQVEITLKAQTDSSVITEIADTQIKSRAPAIVKASVQQSQKQTQQAMPGYLANAQARNL